MDDGVEGTHVEAIVLVSGGLDSCTVATYAKATYPAVAGVSFAYGARHEQAELAAAAEVCRTLAIPYLGAVQLPRIFQNSALTGTGDVPVGRRLEAVEGVAPTYVPARNSVFLSLGAAIAESREAGVVCFGAHREDHVGYPDCRPEYVDAMSQALALGTVTGVRVDAPFIGVEKSEIVRAAHRLNAPLHLTHSCYLGTTPACGRCDTCQIRIDAFQKAGFIDPIPYAVPLEWGTCRPFASTGG